MTKILLASITVLFLTACSPALTPVPSASALPPTATTVPTATPVPPTATSLPNGTATPLPTNTPLPGASDTPAFLTPSADSYSSCHTAREFARNGDFKNALADVNQCVQLNPKYAYAYDLRGNIYDDSGNSDLALADYAQALQLATSDSTIYYDRAIAFTRKGDADNAIANFDQAIRLDPNYTNAFCNRGVQYYYKNNQDAGISDLDRCINLDPTRAGAHLIRGLLHAQRGDTEDAKIDLRTYAQTTTDESLKNQVLVLVDRLDRVPSLSPSNLDGTWIGTTSQGKGIQFSIKNGSVTDLTVEFVLAGCDSPLHAINPAGQYKGNTFSLTSFDFSATGKFTSGISAIGGMTALCGQKVDFVWNAIMNPSPTPTSTQVSSTPYPSRAMSKGGLIPGDSMADSALQKDTLAVVIAIASSQCAAPKVVDSQIQTPLKDGKWTERWTVDGCGSLIRVRINFAPASDGGTDMSVSIEK